jgi:hypothetical protein
MDIFRGYGVEITLAKPADFLVVKETLTRIGVPQDSERILHQSCHILHKQGRYVIIHYKELNALDGRENDIQPEDILRRNKIVALLVEWELVKVIDPAAITEQLPINQMKILNFKEKNDWKLTPKYLFWQRKNP